MKRFLAIAISLTCFSASGLQAQPSPDASGIYQELILGVDSAQGIVTGYYKEVSDPPNMAHVECSFYLYGKKQDGHYAIQAWSPGEKKIRVTPGKLSFFSSNNTKPSVLLKLDTLERDCTAVRPSLAKGQGAYFDLKKDGAWSEVRMVANSNSPYYQAPDLSAPTRDSAKRSTVLTVMDKQGAWAQVQSNQKPKGWIREADLYPTNPTAVAAEPQPLPIEKAKAVAPKAPSSPSVPEKQPEIAVPTTPKPTTELESQLESKDVLVAHLKTLNAQAFEMALQVLKNPTKRSALASKRIEMQKDFDSVVSRLQKNYPSVYIEESKEIFEAFLDLLYLDSPQTVVSLRLNKVLQGSGK